MKMTKYNLLTYTLLAGMFFLSSFPATVYSQTDQSQKMQMIEERLRALESKLGIEPSSTSDDSLDQILNRLESLEQAVFESQEAIPAVPAPTQSGQEMQWQEWTGDEEELTEYIEDTDDAGSGGYLDRYGSAFGLELNGYGVTSYQYNRQTKDNTFRADGIELDITKRLTDWAVLGADLDFFNEGLDPIFPAYRHGGFNNGTGGGIYGTSSGGDDDDDFILEQLFVRSRVTDQIEVTGGKFNVPVGLERRDPHARYNVLPSLLFPLWPRDLTGVMATYKLNEQFSVSPYVFNGFDLDTNNNDSFIYALYSNYQVIESLNVASTIAYGPPLPDNNSDDAFLFDVEFRYTGIPNTWLGFEYMYVTAETDNVRLLARNNIFDVRYQGFLGMAHYDFNDIFGLTLQSSLVKDEDGFIWGTAQDRWEFSVIPSMKLSEAFELRAQYQHVQTDASISFLENDGITRTIDDSNDIFMLTAIVSF